MLRLFGAAVAAIAVLAGIIIGGYHLGWWFRADATNRNTQVVEHSYGFQQSLIDGAEGYVATVNTISSQLVVDGITPEQSKALRGQRLAIASQACAAIVKITDPPADLAQFATANCTGGSAMTYSNAQP